MFTLRHTLLIRAPIARLFALSTSLALVELDLGMHPIAGDPGKPETPPARTSGLVTAGDTIRWHGMQLGFPNHHTSLIVPETWNPPYFFQDRMIAGRFRSFEHDHRLTETPDGTLLADEVRFALPLGPLGALVGRTILVPHIRGLLHRRFQRLKRLAESEEWRPYLSE